jgi:tetratricopeptide (TPR) repeat protein
MRSPITVVILTAAFGVSVAAQEHKPTATETAEKKPDLGMTAVGRQHHAIQTGSKEAQDYFDQGLTFIYGFNHEEAARAFQRAAELDASSPMPLWGIALAVGPNYNLEVDSRREKLAYQNIQKATALAARAPQMEKDYVAALAVRYSGDEKPDYKQLARNYASAMKKLAQKYPDDTDAATLYAESLMVLNPWRLWTLDGRPGENTEEIIRVLESVLARDPQNAGANHYYIHAVEASDRPQRALPSAQRLEAMVPEAGHLVHMPAHIYIRTGDFDAAVRTNVLAVKADRKYALEAQQSGSIYDLMYHSHNEHFIAMAASMAGRYAEARAAADGLAKRIEPHAQAMLMLDLFIATPIWVDARFAKWDAILARPEPPKLLPATHLFWTYSRALAMAARGDTEKASAERDAFQKEVSSAPPDAPFGQNRTKEVLSLAVHVLDARLATAKGNSTVALEHWRKAVEMQDQLIYDEPADWYYPVRESLGAALLSAGSSKEAEQTFRDDLVHNPRNPRSLFGLMESLKAQNRLDEASLVERQFKAAWKSADSKLEIKGL